MVGSSGGRHEDPLLALLKDLFQEASLGQVARICPLTTPTGQFLSRALHRGGHVMMEELRDEGVEGRQERKSDGINISR